jgi:23S rRNA (guanosine2251-2'-O)-methyltransferase
LQQKRLPNLVMGRNCLLEIIRRAPEKLSKIYCGSNGAVAWLQEQHSTAKYELKSNEWLSSACNSVNHQGVAAELDDFPYYPLSWLEKELAESEEALILAIDKLEDPQNFGSLLRLAECFGVIAVVYSKNRVVKLTPVVAKASVGAVAFVPLVEVGNLVNSLVRLKKSGAWIVATALDPKSSDIYTFDFPAKTIAVLGSEGAGISRLMQSEADFLVKVPLFGEIDSLNVSQAAAITLFSYRGRFS